MEKVGNKGWKREGDTYVGREGKGEREGEKEVEERDREEVEERRKGWRRWEEEGKKGRRE